MTNSAPALLIVCAFTKFVCARFVNSLRPLSLIQILLNNWACLLGKPSSIVCDRGTHFQGPDWSALCSSYSIRMVLAPTGSHYQVGTVERQVELIKRTYRKVSATTELSPKQDKLSLVCAARNITPSSATLWSPLFLLQAVLTTLLDYSMLVSHP